MSVIDSPTAEQDKEYLISLLEGTASWREMKAAEYPDDTRNSDCAETLYRTAEAVRILPATHPLFRAIAAVTVDEFDGWLATVNFLVSHAGFHSSSSPQDIIQQLLDATEKTLQDQQRSNLRLY